MSKSLHLANYDSRGNPDLPSECDDGLMSRWQAEHRSLLFGWNEYIECKGVCLSFYVIDLTIFALKEEALLSMLQ